MNYTEEYTQLPKGALDPALKEYKLLKVVLLVLLVVLSIILIVSVALIPWSEMFLMAIVGVISLGGVGGLLLYIKKRNELTLKDEDNQKMLILKGKLADKKYVWSQRFIYI